MHSHYSFSFVNRQPLRVVKKLLLKAIERENESRAWALYTSIYPHFTEESFISYDSFIKDLLKNDTTNNDQTIEDILIDVKKILEKNEWAPELPELGDKIGNI